jgi:hypothetical protein
VFASATGNEIHDAWNGYPIGDAYGIRSATWNESHDGYEIGNDASSGCEIVDGHGIPIAIDSWRDPWMGTANATWNGPAGAASAQPVRRRCSFLSRKSRQACTGYF